MKNLLIAESAYKRLQSELDALRDQVCIYLMDNKGNIYLDGQECKPEEIDLHLGWFNRDLLADKTNRTFAKIMLKSANLEWMQTLSAGVDNPFFKMLAEKNIRLSNSDAQAPAIAEYVISAVMHRYQDFDLRKEYQKNKEWKENDFREIFGSNWLIIGFGNIGARVGRGVQALDAHVTGVKRQARTEYKYADSLIAYEDISSVLSEQDVVVLSCALTEETRGMVNQAFLRKMKRNAIIVNIGRGDLINEPALLSSLDNSDLDCAVLDVFETEPLPEESEFWSHERVILTPHSSNRGLGTNDRGDTLFLSNLKAYLNQEELLTEVNTEELRQ